MNAPSTMTEDRSPAANNRFAQLPGSVSSLSYGFIIYICHGDTLQLVSLAMLRISKASYTGNCANPDVGTNALKNGRLLDKGRDR